MKLKDYIQGKRHGKEANQLEREAMNNPFMQDALDGFDAVSGNHYATIEELENKLQQKQSSKKKTINFRWWSIAAAASIILLIGIGGLLQFDFNAPPQIALKLSEKDSTHDQILTEKNKISIETTDKFPENVIAQNVESKSRNQENKPQSIEIKNVAQVKIESQSTEQNDIQTSDNMESEDVIHFVPSSSVAKLSGNKISGVVLDEIGEPLIGANVMIKGTNIGTIADKNGNFELTVPKGKEKDLQLVATYLGFQRKEVLAISNSNVIKMELDNIAISEVVVVGYGTSKRKSVVGAVSASSTQNDFGEKEFNAYYKKSRNTELCETSKTVIKASFFIDSKGKPTKINVEKAPCPDMEQEFIELAQNSPKWTKTNRKIRISINL